MRAFLYIGRLDLSQREGRVTPALPFFCSMTDSMQFEALDWRVVASTRSSRRIGRRIIYHPSLASTNIIARSLLRDPDFDGTVVLADVQTHGRGRLGRGWDAPPRSGLAVSVCLFEPATFALQTLSIAAALAAGDAVRAVVGERCTLKWPNDVQLDGAKVGGILIELEQNAGGWGAVLGIGLNVNAAPDLPTAISLAAATGVPIAREEVLNGLLDALEIYVAVAERSPDELIRQWRSRLDTLGRAVSVQTPAGIVTGVAIDVGADGALRVLTADGAVTLLYAGEVTLAGSIGLSQ